MGSIEPEEYRKILKSFELKSIELESIKAYRKPLIGVPKLNANLKELESRFEINKDRSIIIFTNIQVKGKQARRLILNIECSFKLQFSSQIPISEDFLKIYEKASLKINIRPYVRELVQSITLRMGLPPLVLPLYKT